MATSGETGSITATSDFIVLFDNPGLDEPQVNCPPGRQPTRTTGCVDNIPWGKVMALAEMTAWRGPFLNSY